MPQAQIIDGKLAAAELRASIAKIVSILKIDRNLVPGLAVVIVGRDPASRIYTRNKIRQTEEAGMRSLHRELPENVTENELIQEVRTLNENKHVHGVLVQLPLPPHINTNLILDLISPEKDVDGFHPVNTGRLAIGRDSLIPCTPQGCMLLLRRVLPNLTGLHAVIVGRSNIVGKPLLQLLLAEHCTVTISHSRTQGLPELCSQADILVAAVGHPEMVRGSWIKPGSIVIDVGINRLKGPDESTRLVGDVAFEEAAQLAKAITPVPGGVGPMTIACLLSNCVKAACRQHGLPPPTLAEDLPT
jgi:methylenetetrahydrofolate dehydrogenase (NADP+)/methenyltetrahydrofolate cyclohydrolase